MSKRPGKYVPPHLEKLKISRGPRKPGEVFTMKLQSVGFVFGRVISDACGIAPSPGNPRNGPWTLTPGVYLVYVYRSISKRFEDIPELKPDNLLIPPEMIIGAGWTHGYFLPVRQDRLTSKDVLPVHCFERKFGNPDGSSFIGYVDEYGRRLGKRTEPCAQSGLGSFGSLAIQVGAALGLPPPRDDTSR